MKVVHEREQIFERVAHKSVHVPNHPLRGIDAAGAARVKAVLQGSTAHFEVYYDPALGVQGPQLADALLSVCENDYATLQTYFNGIEPKNLPFKLVLTTDNTGASHATCESTTLFIGARSGPDVDFIRSLVIAEADEVFEANIGLGWDCGASNGEGLSRVLANSMYPGVEPANFMSASVWLNSPRPDFINQTDPSDRNYPSIGCSVLFLNWLHSQLGYKWDEIITNGAPTLSEMYHKITGRNDAWQRFSTLVEELWPQGTIVDLGTDNPFPLTAAVERTKALAHNGKQVAMSIGLEDFSESIIKGTLRALTAYNPAFPVHNGHSAASGDQLIKPVIRLGLWFEISNGMSVTAGPGAPMGTVMSEGKMV